MGGVSKGEGVNGERGGGLSIYPLICEGKKKIPPPPWMSVIRRQGNRLSVQEALTAHT